MKDFVNMIETIKEKLDKFDNSNKNMVNLCTAKASLTGFKKQSLNWGSKPAINRVTLTHFLTSLFNKYFSYKPKKQNKNQKQPEINKCNRNKWTQNRPTS